MELLFLYSEKKQQGHSKKLSSFNHKEPIEKMQEKGPFQLKRLV
jgi:hypothetical protein